MECKICNRKFANGKAVGGHMRSHFGLLPIPSKRVDEINVPFTDTSSSIVSCDERESSDNKSALTLVKSKRAIRISDDRISESPLMMDEDVAMCLVMLSRDVWRNTEESAMRDKINYECSMCDKVFKSAQGLGSHMSNHHHQKKLKKSSDVIFKNHVCRFCDKVGGHKKVHRMLKSKLSSSLVENRSRIDLNLPPEIENEDGELHSY